MDDLPMFTIDVATDGVLSAIYRIEQAVPKGLVTAVIPLGPAQQAPLDAAVRIDGAWFPSGIGFIRDSVGVQEVERGWMMGSESGSEQRESHDL